MSRYNNRADCLSWRCCSDWKKHLVAETDTEDTDEDHNVGGLGKYSHKDTGLSHSHWIDQVLCNGGFNVGCTQAAEASHKTSMRLPSKRVQHRRDNVTTSNMQEYLCLHSVFEKIFRDHWFNQQSITTKQHRRPTPFGVQLLLNISMDRVDMRSTVLQRQFLHSRVRLTRSELLDLLHMKLQLTPTLKTYDSMSLLRWTFGTKLSMGNNGVYYHATEVSSGTERSKVYLLRGFEKVYYRFMIPCVTISWDEYTVLWVDMKPSQNTILSFH